MATLPEPVEVKEDAGIEEFVDAIERRRDDLELPRPWSVAELGLDDEDYARLNRWAARLGGRAVREWTEDTRSWTGRSGGSLPSRRARLGLLLLAIAAEAARREATEATLWPHVRSTLDRTRWSRADADLFIGGQPNPAFKKALEAAVAEFGLRHAMDDDDTKKRYYLTVFLQIGFGIRDAEAGLRPGSPVRLPRSRSGGSRPVGVLSVRSRSRGSGGTWGMVVTVCCRPKTCASGCGLPPGCCRVGPRCSSGS